jgi:hypothetical protein
MGITVGTPLDVHAIGCGEELDHRNKWEQNPGNKTLQYGVSVFSVLVFTTHVL